MSQSEKQLAAGQRRTLRSIRQRLLTMADAWEGVDEYSRSCLTELADQAEDVALALTADDAQVQP